MPRVSGNTYFDRSRGKSVNMRGYGYYDTKAGRRYKTEHQYLNRKYIREEGRTRSQRESRRGRLRVKGKTPTRVQRRVKTAVNYEEYEGLRDSVIRYMRRYPNRRGYLQMFVPADSDIEVEDPGSPDVGPNPHDPSNFVIGEWYTLRYTQLRHMIPLTLEYDPPGDSVWWRVLGEI